MIENIGTVPGALTPEQQFKLEKIRREVGAMTVEQAQDYVVKTFRLLMLKDNLVRDLLRGL